MTPKAQATKEKIDKIDFIKIKHFCASKDTIKKVKRQLMEQEKIFVNHISAKELVCRIYKVFLLIQQLKKTNNPIKKWTRDLNRHFQRKYIKGQ